MSLTEIDNEINKLIVDLIPYLFINNSISHNGLGVITKNDEINKMIATGKIKEKDAIAYKHQLLKYLNDLIKYGKIESEKAKPKGQMVSAEEVFADLCNKNKVV